MCSLIFQSITGNWIKMELILLCLRFSERKGLNEDWLTSDAYVVQRSTYTGIDVEL